MFCSSVRAGAHYIPKRIAFKTSSYQGKSVRHLSMQSGEAVQTLLDIFNQTHFLTSYLPKHFVAGGAVLGGITGAKKSLDFFAVGPLSITASGVGGFATGAAIGASGVVFWPITAGSFIYYYKNCNKLLTRSK